MKEIQGNIWNFHKQGYWIVITTNGIVKSNGEAVMGRGVALQAKQKFPTLPSSLGYYINLNGNVVQHIPGFSIIAFPVKYKWSEKASLELIESSCQGLVRLISIIGVREVYIVRPGCGNGGLDWEDVKPILEKYLDDRFRVVQL